MGVVVIDTTSRTWLLCAKLVARKCHDSQSSHISIQFLGAMVFQTNMQVPAWAGILKLKYTVANYYLYHPCMAYLRIWLIFMVN